MQAIPNSIYTIIVGRSLEENGKEYAEEKMLLCICSAFLVGELCSLA